MITRFVLKSDQEVENPIYTVILFFKYYIVSEYRDGWLLPGFEPEKLG